MDFSLSQKYLKIHYVLIQASIDEKTINSIFGVRNLFSKNFNDIIKFIQGQKFVSNFLNVVMNGHNLYTREHWVHTKKFLQK